MASVQAKAAGGSSREEGRLPATARSLGGRSFDEACSGRGFRLSAIVKTAAQHPEPQPQLQHLPSQDEGTLPVMTGVTAEGFTETKAFSSLTVGDCASAAELAARDEGLAARGEGLALAAAMRTAS